MVTGSFDRAYLALPAAVIRAVARGHQRYFCVEKAARRAFAELPRGRQHREPARPHHEGDRPRHARAPGRRRFFWEEDQKSPLDARYDKLGGIVFHNRLGTVKEKVERIERLAALVADTLALDGATKAEVARAARLCKCDLVTLMVGEFPELQGHMGRAYALAQKRVARRRRRHPRSLQARRRAGRRRARATSRPPSPSPTASTRSPAASPWASPRPARPTRSRCGARASAALRTLLDRRLRPRRSRTSWGWRTTGCRGARSSTCRASRPSPRSRSSRPSACAGLLASATSAPVADAVLEGTAEAALQERRRRAGARPGAPDRGRREGAVARQGEDRRQAPLGHQPRGAAGAARRRRVRRQARRRTTPSSRSSSTICTR